MWHSKIYIASVLQSNVLVSILERQLEVYPFNIKHKNNDDNRCVTLLEVCMSVLCLAYAAVNTREVCYILV